MQTLGENEGKNPDLEDSDNHEENTDDTEKEGTMSVPLLVFGQLTPMESWIAFEIDLNININSKALLDMISETDTVSVATAKATCALKPTNAENNITVAEAFENW